MATSTITITIKLKSPTPHIIETERIAEDAIETLERELSDWDLMSQLDYSTKYGRD